MPNLLSVSRGDIILVPFPNSNLRTAKLRPALVVQADNIDSDIPQVIVAMITSKIGRSGRKSRVLVQANTANGRSSGLLFQSVVMTDNLATVHQTEIVRIIGVLREMSEVNTALRHSLAL